MNHSGTYMKVSVVKRDQIIKKFFFEIMNILDQMIKFTFILLMKKFLIKFLIWFLFAVLIPYIQELKSEEKYK